jgi:stage II sporulation protein P
MKNMNKHKWEEITAQIAFYIISIYILIRIFIPIINPVKTAADISYNQSSFYKQILNKASASIEVVDNSYEDEDKKELLQLIFKYLTNIDVTNPKTYIASQIPILQFIDFSTIISNESGPVVVVPTEDTKTPQTTVTTTPSTTIASGDTGNDTSSAKPVNPNETASIPKKTLTPSKPIILIFHTHTTEAYNPDKIKDKNFSLDLVDGVCTVGDELEKELESKYGIATIHDKTVHDIVREGGYKKARPTISSYLKKYPSIKIVIDLHRDGGLKRNSSTAIIKNETYARTMFVIGTKNKKHSKNEAFANKLNSLIESQYPGFSKGLYYEDAVYNEDLFSNMALIEIGSDINSVDEALRTSKILAKILALYLK